MSASVVWVIGLVSRVPIARGPGASRFVQVQIGGHGVVRVPGVTWAGRHVVMFRARAGTRDPPGAQLRLSLRARRSCCAAVASLASVIESEVQLVWSFFYLSVRNLFALVLLLGLGSVERGGDPRLASRARCPAAPVGPSADRAGRSCAAGDARSGASAPSVGGLLGAAGDVAALAAPARVAALEVSAQEAGTATSRAAAAGADLTSRA